MNQFKLNVLSSSLHGLSTLTHLTFPWCFLLLCGSPSLKKNCLVRGYVSSIQVLLDPIDCHSVKLVSSSSFCLHFHWSGEGIFRKWYSLLSRTAHALHAEFPDQPLYLQIENNSCLKLKKSTACQCPQFWTRWLNPTFPKSGGAAMLKTHAESNSGHNISIPKRKGT